MDFWTLTGSLLLLAAGVLVWRQQRLLEKEREENRTLRHMADSWHESSDTWMERYREAADQAEVNAAARDEFEAKARNFAKMWADADTAKEAAELEAERARKECWMHEQECRQLKDNIRKLHDEYKKLLHKETDAEALVRREFENFFAYDGSEKGQEALPEVDNG